MDAENLGAVCICCGPDPQHHLILTMPANVPVQAQRRVSTDVAWNRGLDLMLLFTKNLFKFFFHICQDFTIAVSTKLL